MISVSVAPSGPPTSVVVHVASSTSLELSWGLPALVERNGVVLGYVVTIADQAHSISNQYNISGTHLTVHGISTKHFTDSNLRAISLVGLHPFKEYLIAVRAWSDYGLGPQSNIVTAQTPEDGNKLTVIWRCYACNFSLFSPRITNECVCPSSQQNFSDFQLEKTSQSKWCYLVLRDCIQWETQQYRGTT